MKSRVVTAVFVPAVFALGVAVAGCGGSSTGTTCDDFAAQDDAARGAAVVALLEPHGVSSRDLESYHSVFTKINEYCGLRSASAGESEAAQNNGEPIDAAVDWDALPH